MSEILQIIKKAQEGDTEAFGQLYRLYYAPVFRYILLRMGDKDHSEDLSQEVFLKAFRSMDTFDIKKTKSDSMLPYLFTIARNTIIDYKKKASSDEIVDDEIIFNYANVTELPSNAFEKEAWSIWLYKALSELSPLEREVLELKFLSELSTDEVAHILHKNPDAIRQLQSRGIKNLRDILKRDQKRYMIKNSGELLDQPPDEGVMAEGVAEKIADKIYSLDNNTKESEKKKTHLYKKSNKKA